jgi:hypothetical protein
MPYYKGDYYRGDYYRGDPSIFGSIGSAISKLVKPAAAFLAGGPIGAAVSTIGSIVGQIGGPQRPPPTQFPALAGGVTPISPVAAGMSFGITASGPKLIGPSGSVSFSTGGGQQLMKPGQRGHPNKSTYVTRGGGTSHWPNKLQVHPKGSVIVRSRRMNPGNGRALHRAARRIHSAVKMYRKIFSLAHGKPMHGRPFVKRRRKR